MITEGERLHWHRQPDTWNKTAKRSPILLVSTPWHIFPKYLGVDGYERSLHRLSVSESEEWVCTKTVFPNSSTLRACEKTYTGFVKIYYKRVKKNDLRHSSRKNVFSNWKHFRRREILKLFLQQLTIDPPSLPLLFRVLQLGQPIFSPCQLYLRTDPLFGAICSTQFPYHSFSLTTQ